MIFALDSAGKTAGVCLLDDDTVIYEKYLNEGLTHSQTLLPLADTAFKAAGIVPADVDAYAVTKGPGSFTGLRIGLGLVKGLALPFGTPVAPVSTLEALAMGCEKQGAIVAALNARRGEVYWAAFVREGGTLARVTPDAATPAESLWPTLEGMQHPICFIGDGAGICYTMYKDRVQAAVDEEERAAYGAALLAQRPGALVAAADARPEYLRLSQAERERAARMKTGG